MLSYSDDAKDLELAQFLRKWTPDGIGHLKVTEDNLRYNIARARAAEARLKEINDAINAMKKVFG